MLPYTCLQEHFCQGGQREEEEGQGGDGAQSGERRLPDKFWWASICVSVPILIKLLYKMLPLSQETPYFSHLRCIFSIENMYQQALYVSLKSRIKFPNLPRSIYTPVGVIQKAEPQQALSQCQGV